VMDVFCRDTALNISATYLKPAAAFGGSCLPKDVRALTYKARQLDVDTPMLATVSDEFREEFLQADNPMRTVLITSGAPEEGKSTVAMALAGAVALAGKRTLLVECDLRRPCFADRLGLNRDPGLTDYLVGRAEPADVLQVVKLISPSTVNGDKEATPAKEGVEEATLVCITAGSQAPLPAELLGSDRFSSFLSKVSSAYDLVVLDTSPILSVVDALEVVPQVDGLVVCVRLARTTREEARATREALAHLPGRPTGVVVTGVSPDDESYYGYHYGAYGPDDR